MNCKLVKHDLVMRTYAATANCELGQRYSFFNMLLCFSLFHSYMLGLGLARCDLGLNHGLAGLVLCCVQAFLKTVFHNTTPHLQDGPRYAYI